MKKKKSKLAKSAKRSPRKPALIIAAIAVVAIAAITVVSRQLASRETSASQKTNATARTAEKKYMTVKIAGQDVQLDENGKMKPLTPEEAQKLAEGLKGMLNKSSQGLVAEQKPDGSVEMDLQGRFQNVTVARENTDGTVSTSCVDNPKAAAAFYGIDPKLIESEKTNLQPVKPKPPVQ